MKIFHLITSLKIGGAESALVNFLRAANNNPHQHLVAYFHPGPHIKTLTNMGVATYHIKGVISYADPLALWRLMRLIKQTKPDLIHSALWSANIIGRLLATYFRLPLICDIHGNSYDEGRMRNWFDRATVRAASHLVAVSSSTRDAYEQNILATKKIAGNTPSLVTINNGIDHNTVRSQAQANKLTRASFGLSDYDFVVGALGRLEPIKSYDLLLKACAQITCRTLKVIIVGGGSQEQYLKNLCHTLGIADQVRFTGYRTDAVSFYPLFDCFVLSSQSEGLSIALLEALCFGLPIVTTNTTPTHDVIKHNIHGLIVPPNDAPALARALKILIENKNKHLSMHDACISLVEKDFSLTSTVAAYHNLYATAHKNFHKN